jgi:transcription elongation factor GreA
LSCTEALSQYVAEKKNGKKSTDGHHEIGRFIAWIGRERVVTSLAPSEVADYAHYVGLGGSDAGVRLAPVKEFLAFMKTQGWIEKSLATHLRIPRTRKTTTGSSKTMNAGSTESTQLSQEGYEKLVGQLDELKIDRVTVVEDIKYAMEDKDFRENSPLDAAKERQGLIESKIRELESALSRVQIITQKGRKAQQAKVSMGCTVTIKDGTSGKKLLYTLVDVREADVSVGKISTQSPVGRALLDKRVGEEISINIPKGTLSYKIEKIGA